MGKTFPAFPAHAQPAILPIWQEIHAITTITGTFMSMAIHTEPRIWAFWNWAILVLQLLTSRYVSVPGPSFRIGLDLLPLDFLYVISVFSIRIFYREVPGFATDFPYGAVDKPLASCILVQFLEIVLKKQLVPKLFAWFPFLFLFCQVDWHSPFP